MCRGTHSDLTVAEGRGSDGGGGRQIDAGINREGTELLTELKDETAERKRIL